MKFSDLGLNRWGYKAVQQTETTDSSNMSSDTPTYKAQTQQNSQTQSGGDDAKNIQPGTVIKSCIILGNEYTATSLHFVAPVGSLGATVISLGISDLAFLLADGVNYEMDPSFFGPGVIDAYTNHPNLGTSILPWNIVYATQVGDASNKVDLYGSVIACPLPTVLNALDIIRKIPEPTTVGERGHYGDGLYFDDETFPDEILWEVNGKKELEHTKMIGLLMKAVTELTKKVDDLEKRLL